MRKFIDSQGGRRFIFGLVVFIVASAFLWFGKIGEVSWLDLTKWIGVSFILAASATGVADRFAKNGKDDPPAPSNTTMTSRPGHPPIG